MCLTLKGSVHYLKPKIIQGSSNSNHELHPGGTSGFRDIEIKVISCKITQDHQKTTVWLMLKVIFFSPFNKRLTYIRHGSAHSVLGFHF